MKGQFPKSKTICPQSQSRSKNNSVQLKDYLSEDRQDRYKQKAHVYNNKRDKSVHNMSTIEVASLPPLCRNTFSIKRKEEEALERLLSLKKRNTKYSSKRVTTEYPQQLYIIKRRNSTAPFVSMEAQKMKPTDKYFHQLDNIRMAQRLLLVKPSQQVSKQHLKKSYRNHCLLKMNITRMSFVSKKDKKSRTKKFSKKWLD